MWKFPRGKPGWNLITDWTTRVEILTPCKQFKNNYVIDKLSQPGLKMIDIFLGFPDNFSYIYIFFSLQVFFHLPVVCTHIIFNIFTAVKEDLRWFLFVRPHLFKTLIFAGFFFYFNDAGKLAWSFGHGNCFLEKTSKFSSGSEIFRPGWKIPCNINFFNSFSQVEIFSVAWKSPYN